MGEWGMLSHPQNKDSLPWTLGSSPRVTAEKSLGRRFTSAVMLAKASIQSTTNAAF